MLVLNFSTGAPSFAYGIQKNETLLASQYIAGQEVVSEAVHQMLPWDHELEVRLRHQFNFKKLEKLMISDLPPHQLVFFQFRVNESGGYLGGKIFQTGGPEQLGKDLAKLVSSAAPFKRPPNLLPMRSYVEIVFVREGKSGGWMVHTRANGLTCDHARLTFEGVSSLEEYLWTHEQQKKRPSKKKVI